MKPRGSCKKVKIALHTPLATTCVAALATALLVCLIIIVSLYLAKAFSTSVSDVLAVGVMIIVFGIAIMVIVSVVVYSTYELLRDPSKRKWTIGGYSLYFSLVATTKYLDDTYKVFPDDEVIHYFMCFVGAPACVSAAVLIIGSLTYCIWMILIDLRDMYRNSVKKFQDDVKVSDMEEAAAEEKQNN